MPTQNPISLVHKVLNITKEESSRVTHAWALRYFFQVGYVLGWTLITAMVVSSFGIEGLPYFFILNGALIILGTYVFSYLVYRFQHRVLFLGTAIGGVLLLASALIFFQHSSELFVATLILVLSIFASQLHILLLSYTEELFSPSENQRVNPLIETAEPLGGITAGLLFVLFVYLVRPEAFVFFWLVALALIIPLFLFHKTFRSPLPLLHVSRQKNSHAHSTSSLGRLGDGVQFVRSVPFVKLLLVVVFLQWVFVNLMDYSYTKALSDAVSHGVSSHGSFEQELTHGLGTLHLCFSGAMFLVQLFVSSRVMSRLGVVRTMMVMPVLNVITSFLFLITGSVGAAIATKGFYEATLVLFNNGYHNSYYAFYEQLRAQVREVLEGGIRSLGVITGTAVIIASQILLSLSQVTVVVAAMMVIVSVVMVILLWFMRPSFTHVSKKNLEYVGAHPEKFNAIEMLTQRGHVDSTDILSKCLLYRNEPSSVKIKILEALGVIGDLSALPEIMSALDDADEHVVIAALESIGSFRGLGEQFYAQAFAKHRVISRLSELFHQKPSLAVQTAVVEALAAIHHPDVVQLLLDGLDTSHDELRANIIYLIGSFTDASTGYYLERYIQDPYPKARANAIISLWQFKKYRLKLLAPLMAMLESEEKEMKKSGIFVLGEIKATQEIPRLIRLLHTNDHDIRRYAAVALAAMNHDAGMVPMVHLLLHPNLELAHKTKRMLRYVSRSSRKFIITLLRQEVHYLLRERYGTKQGISLEELSVKELRELLFYYDILDEEHAVGKIMHVLNDRELELDHINGLSLSSNTVQ